MTMLYASLLGEAFARLPEPLQHIHARAGKTTYRGHVVVTGAQRMLGRLFAAAARLPQAYTGAVEVEIVANDTMEQWTRIFGAHAMRSNLRVRDGYLHEHLGIMKFDFTLTASASAIVWRIARVRALGLPLPAHWFAGVRAHESTDQGSYHFDVEARMPLVGLIVHYAGWLALD